jgi:accessory gene regulator protein AgrB
MMQYTPEEMKDHPVVRKYIDQLKYTEYLMKLRKIEV